MSERRVFFFFFNVDDLKMDGVMEADRSDARILGLGGRSGMEEDAMGWRMAVWGWGGLCDGGGWLPRLGGHFFPSFPSTLSC